MDSQVRFSIVSSWNLVHEADNMAVYTTCKFCPSFLGYHVGVILVIQDAESQ